MTDACPATTIILYPTRFLIFDSIRFSSFRYFHEKSAPVSFHRPLCLAFAEKVRVSGESDRVAATGLTKVFLRDSDEEPFFTFGPFFGD